mgnify:CR=1 FL=1
MSKILDTNVTKWRNNFTSADTNTPADTSKIFVAADTSTQDIAPTSNNIITAENLGGQIRNVKAVIKEDLSDKAVEKWEFNNPTYLGRDEDTGLEKVQIDGIFDAAIFSYGTKVFFSTNSGDWATSDKPSTTINNYRENGATVVKIDTVQTTGKTIVYCQMPLRFLDCFNTQSGPDRGTGSFTGKKKTVSSTYANNLLTSFRGLCFYTDTEFYIAEPDKLPGYVTATDENNPSSYFMPGDSIVIYKCAQGTTGQSAKLGAPLQYDASGTNLTKWKANDSSPIAANFPTMDTATGHVWRVKSASRSTINNSQWSVQVEDKDSNNDTYTNPDLGDDANSGGNTSRGPVWFGINIDPVYVTAHFTKVTGVAVNGTGFKMYVSAVKGDATQSGQAYRRLSESNVQLLGDGTSKQFKIYFYTNDLEKFAPGYGGYNTWISQISAENLLTGAQDRKYDMYSINTQVTSTVPELSSSSFNVMEDKTCLFRPSTKPNNVAPADVNFYTVFNKRAIYFTVEFEEAIPADVTVVLDYSLSAMDHARLTPNLDPETYAAPTNTAEAWFEGTATETWDPDNEKS